MRGFQLNVSRNPQCLWCGWFNWRSPLSLILQNDPIYKSWGPTTRRRTASCLSIHSSSITYTERQKLGHQIQTTLQWDWRNKRKLNVHIMDAPTTVFCPLQNHLWHFNWVLIRFLNEELDIKTHKWNTMPRDCIQRKMQIISFVSIVWFDLQLSFHYSFPRRFLPIDNTWFSDWIRRILMSFLCRFWVANWTSVGVVKYL